MGFVHTFTTETEIARPIDEVFAFFSDAANLERITPPELRFEILTPAPIDLREGAIIDYRLRLLGAAFQWKTRIAAWDPPGRFVDEQLRGPYRQWIHEHTFSAHGHSTLMRDTVRWALPLQPFGQVAYPFVRLQVARIFAYRRKRIGELMEGARSSSR